MFERRPEGIIILNCFSLAGPPDQLQPDVGRLPVPAGQALRRLLRHGRQGHPVRKAQRHLQVLAPVEGEGERDIFHDTNVSDKQRIFG